MNLTPAEYGTGDATYNAAGGEDGIRRLVNCFYDEMRDNPDYQRIWGWHPEDKTTDNGSKALSRDKLACFLCGWMGGPKRYHEKYGGINIPHAHKHLSITDVERDMWLSCMSFALSQQGYPEAFQKYLLEQLSRPAQMITNTCAANYN